MKKFSIIVEAQNSEYNDLYTEIDNKIKSTCDRLKVDYNEFLSNYINESGEENSKTKIDGLISDSDLYDFYMEGGVIQQQIDSYLSKVGYFKKELQINGIYDYVVKSVTECILNVVQDLIEQKTNTEEQ